MKNKNTKNKSTKNKSTKNWGVLKVIVKLTPIIIAASPFLFWLDVILAILHGTSWGVITMMQQRFFDQVSLLVTGDTNLTRTIMALIFLAISYIICQILNGAENYVPDVMLPKKNGKLTYDIHSKISKLHPIDFENTNRLDDINKAERGMEKAVMFVSTFINIFIFYIPYFIFMGWYLFSMKPTLALSIVLVFIPTAATQVMHAKVFVKLEDKSAPARRELEHYNACMIDREYFKETRLLGAFKYFESLYFSTLHKIQKLNYKVIMKANLLNLGMQVLTVIGYCVIILLLFDSLMKKQITVGAFAAIFNSIAQLYVMMNEVVGEEIGSLARDFGGIQNFINFINMDERTGTIENPPEWGDIELKNVTFCYPNKENAAIKDISFTLNKGETIAIVGENGSGKSTLVKVIMGLYNPDRGQVLFNDVDTSLLTAEALYKNTTGVFQKYQRYQMTLEDNINISDKNKQYNIKYLDELANLSGIDINATEFSEKYETMLSREFDGVELSGGQWQRVAVARGFFKKHNFIVLDEPTAAIDPIEETKVYNRFAEISKNKSAIIVTHRLGSVKLADRIIVMKEGIIEGIGTHDWLMLNSKEYNRLYSLQEQWYKEDLV